MKGLRLALLTLTLTLVSCGSLNPIDMAKSAFSDDKGLEVNSEIVAGDKQESHEGQIGNRSNQQADQITNVNEIPFTVLLLLVLGWLLPSPAEMWKGLVRLLPWVK